MQATKRLLIRGDAGRQRFAAFRPRFISSTTRLLGVKEDFDASVASLQSLPQVDNQVKLKLYALYKQSTEGACNTKKPGAFDFVGKAKWEAWMNHSDLSKEDAMKRYTHLVSTLLPKKAEGGAGGSAAATDDLIIANKDGILSMRLNRPKKMNSLTIEMYEKITTTLNAAADDESVRIAVLAGSGAYYSSGTDLSAFVGPNPPPLDSAIDVMIRYVDSFINFPKPLVAAVNGPALGISVTTLGLCDFVYASSRATFQTPFAATGQSPEGCSSLTFPELMGRQRASEMLLLGRKFTAEQAAGAGLVSRVFPHESFDEEVQGVVRALQAAKRLVSERRIEELKEVNRREAQVLRGRWEDKEYKDAVQAFLARAKGKANA